MDTDIDIVRKPKFTKRTANNYEHNAYAFIDFIGMFVIANRSHEDNITEIDNILALNNITLYNGILTPLNKHNMFCLVPSILEKYATKICEKKHTKLNYTKTVYSVPIIGNKKTEISCGNSWLISANQTSNFIDIHDESEDTVKYIIYNHIDGECKTGIVYDGFVNYRPCTCCVKSKDIGHKSVNKGKGRSKKQWKFLNSFT